MKIENIGERGVLFTFAEGDSNMAYPTSVYLIIGKETLYLCDTHLGEKSMEVVKKYIEENLQNRELIIFNTHSHYDHVWGNCAFKDNLIIAHEKCLEEMINNGLFAMEDFKEFKNGIVELVLPNVTFNENLNFQEDDIEFLYTPGHSIDSAVCWDKANKILYLGDLVELPLPMLLYYKLDVYIKTLKELLKLPFEIALTSHSGIVSREVIINNLKYVESVFEGKEPDLEEDFKPIHQYNLKSIIISKYRELAKEKWGIKFEAQKFHDIVVENKDKDIKELEKLLEMFIV